MTAGGGVLPGMTDFDATLRQHGAGPLLRGSVETLQVNVGKLCNMACHHCHVDAGPKRTEVMAAPVADRLVELLAKSPQVLTLDLTGGAPELNANFRAMVRAARGLGRRVIDRCNLTVLLEPGMEDLAEFLAGHRVHVIASLPCYSAENVERQRGRGAFGKSVEALRRLNALGYGHADSGLELDLVYNPTGPFLPPPQQQLEADYREELHRRFEVAFNRLLTITNMPIQRFAAQLERTGQVEAYQALLVNHFNAATVPELMCRSLISVSWEGRLYDCDFNQMLEIAAGATQGSGPRTIWEIETLDDLIDAPVATGPHCYGCTAGAGSSCSGAIR